MITKILKLDENNQYGFAMIKPTLTGCIEEKEPPSWSDFHILLETVDLDDSIGHLLLLIYFLMKKTVPKSNCSTMKLFHQSLKKQKTLDVNERSAYQLLELFDKNKDKPKSYRCSSKSHATLFPKNFILFYLEDLRFLIKRCGWKVTKIYTHFTFEQSRFKRDFVLNNQRKR